MDVDQTEICQFLKSFPDQYVSGKEICRRAGSKWRFREEPTWALPILRRMVECQFLESDDTGRFRLPRHVAAAEANKKPKWISPAIQRILEKSGRNFGGFGKSSARWSISANGSRR